MEDDEAGPVPIERNHWQRALLRADLPEGAKKVGLAAATFGNPDGTRIRPGERILADVFDLRERAVRGHIDTLERVGLLALVEPAWPGHAAEYRLTVPADGTLPMRLDPDWQRLTPRRPVGSRGGHRQTTAGLEPVENLAPNVDNPSHRQTNDSQTGKRLPPTRPSTRRSRWRQISYRYSSRRARWRRGSGRSRSRGVHGRRSGPGPAARSRRRTHRASHRPARRRNAPARPDRRRRCAGVDNRCEVGMSPRREQQRHDLAAAFAGELRRAGCANDTADALSLVLVRIAEGHGWRPTAIDRPPTDPLRPIEHPMPEPPIEYQTARAALRRHEPETRNP